MDMRMASRMAVPPRESMRVRASSISLMSLVNALPCGLSRKAAHLIEYAILAMLLWRAIVRGANAERKMAILYVNLWLAATLVAACDEYHQGFVPSRGAAWGDVLIDSGGAIFGLLIAARKRKTDRT